MKSNRFTAGEAAEELRRVLGGEETEVDERLD